jgi:hypothetical protein
MSPHDTAPEVAKRRRRPKAALSLPPAAHPPGEERDAWLRWLDAVVAWNRGGFIVPRPEAPLNIVDHVLYEVPDSLLVEFALQPGSGQIIRCVAAGTIDVPLAELRGPSIAPGRRGLRADRLRSILSAIAAGTPMESAVPIFREEGSAQAVILNGAHRHAIAVKLGCSTLPCRFVTLDEAELLYDYPDGQQ